MKQALVVSAIIIILSLFGFNQLQKTFITPNAKQLNFTILQAGDILYTGFLDQEQVVWVVQENNTTKVLVDQEILDYYHFAKIPEIGTFSDPSIWEAIYDVSEKDVEINMLYVKDQQLQMYEANCANQQCIRVGAINKPGQTLTCAPHRLVVKINGIGDVDA